MACSPPNHQLKLSSGKVERIENFNSKFVRTRNIDVWFPNDYSTDKKYAVLYMHDGQSLFDGSITWNKQELGVDETLSQLVKEGKVRNTIVVGIWNTEFRHPEYFPQKPFENLAQPFRDSLMNTTELFKMEVNSDKYLKFIVEELKPYIDSQYSTRSNMENTFIAGSSMGGLISMYALCEYPEVFHGAGCISTHWVGTFDTKDNPIPSEFAKYLDSNLPDPQNHRIYFDYGTETLDSLYEPYQIVMDSILMQHSFNANNWETFKFEGENHSEISWRKRLHIPFEFLLSKNNSSK